MPPGPLGRSIANETATCLPHTRPRERRESVQASEHLAGLNEAQRAAVEHGSGDRSGDCRPLLVIAGAGSGKTKTLAHRVANLVVHGADPRRILLLTFSRRAAAELIRRAERVANIALASTRVAVPNPITWSGTFHSVGARLLRHHARDIGLDPAFTIHDREDSADLMNLVRHEHGLSAKGKRFPLKATCLSIYSRVVNAQAPLASVLPKQFPWCTDWEHRRDLAIAVLLLMCVLAAFAQPSRHMSGVDPEIGHVAVPQTRVVTPAVDEGQHEVAVGVSAKVCRKRTQLSDRL